MRLRFISSIRRRFQRLSQSPGQVAHVLLTRSPLIHPASGASPFDLHVLSTPPAFILSQDQTLHKKMMPQTVGIRPEAASSTMTKNEYQTDIHELIQKRPPPTSKTGRQRNKLAFDKCTLLSSQRSDAPAFRSHNLRRRATSLSYTSRPACQISSARRKTPPQLETSSHRSGRNPS
jgi:hypothetical protein